MINTLYPLRTIGTDLFTVAGSFVAAPDSITSYRGFGATPAYVSAGVYTLTFPEKWPHVVCALITRGVAAVTAPAGVSWSYDATLGVLTMTFINDSGTVLTLGVADQVNYVVYLQHANVLGVNAN